MAERIVWSPLAQDQKRAIFEYWIARNKSKTYSRKLYELFNETGELLLKYPELGYPTNLGSVRLKLVRDYWLAYRLKDDEIQILCIWDVRQDNSVFKALIQSLLE